MIFSLILWIIAGSSREFPGGQLASHLIWQTTWTTAVFRVTVDMPILRSDFFCCTSLLINLQHNRLDTPAASSSSSALVQLPKAVRAGSLPTGTAHLRQTSTTTSQRPCPSGVGTSQVVSSIWAYLNRRHLLHLWSLLLKTLPKLNALLDENFWRHQKK